MLTSSLFFHFFMVVTPLHYLQICLATLWMKKSCVFPAVKMTSMYWAGLRVHVHINKRDSLNLFNSAEHFSLLSRTQEAQCLHPQDKHGH